MKKYTLKVGGTFTQKKADELMEYFEAIKSDLREIQWNPKEQDKTPHIWSTRCECDGCLRNNLIQSVIDNI